MDTWPLPNALQPEDKTCVYHDAGSITSITSTGAPVGAFLMALILASKFLQDRCYSNRAWAKLSGLPPREVSRCERTLGDALERVCGSVKVLRCPRKGRVRSSARRARVQFQCRCRLLRMRR
ncbi:hypothetical protein DFH11DRAFT_1501759 [Phellopilus nigrolimitatus]|nr:hypothetical protein DFH11DRAFT_1501759 [Phellopilus nigrolimitatus]